MTDTTGALAIRPGQHDWDSDQLATLTAIGVKDAPPADLKVFFHYCVTTGLDPFSKQIYMIGRRANEGRYDRGNWVDNWVTKWTIQIGIDGFRIIRDRAAKRDHVDVWYSETLWYDQDGRDYKVWVREDPPAACSLTVLKDGKPFPAVLTYREYVQKDKKGNPIGKWKDAPAHQLEKCVEAFGLRRAFPHDLGGIFLEDEVPTPPPDVPSNGNGHQPPRTVPGAIEAQANTRAPKPDPDPGMTGEVRQALQEDSPDQLMNLASTPAEPGPDDTLKAPAINALAGELAKVHISKPAERYRLLCSVTGRSITRADQLTNREGLAIVARIDQALQDADGDVDAAQADLWTWTIPTAEANKDEASPAPDEESSVNDTRPNHDETGAGPA